MMLLFLCAVLELEIGKIVLFMTSLCSVCDVHRKCIRTHERAIDLLYGEDG
jgi:hypothetical protein